MSDIQWKCTAFDELSTHELYAILQLRTEVFVMEQDCAYQDLDGCDQVALHVTGVQDTGLLCYARLLPPGLNYQTPSIGRVIIAKRVRSNGYGKLLMKQALANCRRQWPDQAVTISAQQHLESFYLDLGFITESESYLEDGIPHIQMSRPAK